MSQRVDSIGQRTLAVVTRCDRPSDSLLVRITENTAEIGLGYICVRNRINGETFEEARNQEAALFETHPLVSKIHKSMVGIPALAHRLVQIQLVLMSKCLQEVVNNINERLNTLALDIKKLPQNFTSIHDAIVASVQIPSFVKVTLQKMLFQGEVDEYENDNQMHCNAWLVERIDKLLEDIQSSIKYTKGFLVEEMQVIEEVNNGSQYPQFLNHSVFLCLLNRKLKSISDLPISFVNEVWDYLYMFIIGVLADRFKNYQQLLVSMRKAIHSCMAKTKLMFVERVTEMIEMEKVTYYTCDSEFIASYNKLMGKHDSIFKLVCATYVEGYGTVEIKHLTGIPEYKRDQAFDLKVRMMAYWKIVSKRMVDCIAVQLRFFMQNMMIKEMEREIMEELVMVQGGGIEKMMLDEPPSMAEKREQLQSSIDLLQESKEIIEQAMANVEGSSN
ncbi:hypothetical protein SSX86_005885 [Deinandra increscens subsp. villosa]|uniref:GED domain-containing protein n=1 Tax=Deinandra increscens subsp. villosa TaxID=3103831 RepID=A0AAP0H799_9ASTR